MSGEGSSSEGLGISWPYVTGTILAKMSSTKESSRTSFLAQVDGAMVAALAVVEEFTQLGEELS